MPGAPWFTVPGTRQGSQAVRVGEYSSRCDREANERSARSVRGRPRTMEFSWAVVASAPSRSKRVGT